MLSNELNKEWKTTFFEIFSKQSKDKSEFEKADKLKFEHFPPVIARFYTDLNEVNLDDICKAKLQLKKAKLSKFYDASVIDINYGEIIKEQLNRLMQQQIDDLKQKDPTFLKYDEKEAIENADFPFIKLMTMVYSKDTNEMTEEDQIKWKEQVNTFINQHIIFSVVNTYFTMKLYQDNIYTLTFQTPYNKIHTWDKYASNQEGICVTYDFKEISETNAYHLSKLFPVVYLTDKSDLDSIDYPIYNAYSASLLKIDSNINEEDNGWEYIYSYNYNEQEYTMLDRLLQPAYEKAMNHPEIIDISKKNYLKENDGVLDYDHDAIISDIKEVLNSKDMDNLVGEDLNNVYSITDDVLEIDFLKPEGIYLGCNFPEDKVEEYNKVALENDVKIFKIKEGNGMLYKSLI